jgi:hypothetical protein
MIRPALPRPIALFRCADVGLRTGRRRLQRALAGRAPCRQGGTPADSATVIEAGHRGVLMPLNDGYALPVEQIRVPPRDGAFP